MLKKAPAGAGSGAVWISGTTYDEIVRRLTKLEKVEPQTGGKSISHRPTPSWKEVHVSNVLKTDIKAGSVVGIGNPKGMQDSDQFVANHVFNVLDPSSAQAKRFGITPQGALQNQTSLVVLNGVVTARVNVTDLNHQYAEVDADNVFQLKSVRGPTNILLMHSAMMGVDTLCKVFMNWNHGQSNIFFATMNEPITFGNEGEAEMLDELASPPSTLGTNVTVKYDVFEGPEIAIDKLIAYVPFGDTNRILWAECPDPIPVQVGD